MMSGIVISGIIGQRSGSNRSVDPTPRKRHMPSENGSHRSRMADTLMSQFQRRPENAFYIEPRSGERYPLDRPRWCADGLKPLLLSPQRGITRDEIERGTCWSRSINIS